MKKKFIDADNFMKLDRVQRVQQTELGLVFDLREEKFRVDVLRADVLRFKISQAGCFDESPTFAAAFEVPELSHFQVRDSETEVELLTELVRVVVQKAPFDYAVYRADGSTILRSSGTKEEPEPYKHLNDSFVLSRETGRFDAFYGLGEKTGPFNRRGRRFINWSFDILSNTYEEQRIDPEERNGGSTRFDPYYMVIPFFYHSTTVDGRVQMAGFFIDNGYKSYFDFTARQQFQCLFEGGQYTEYVFAGPKMRDILEAYTWITGRASLPPYWSLGYHQCRWHDYRQPDILSIGEQYRKKNIPCDVLWLDIHYMDGYRVFTWDEEKFPDPAGMLREMEREGFRSITIIDPGVKYEPGYRIYDEGREANFFCKTEEGQAFIGYVWPGKTVFPDFVKPEVRSWWGRLNAEHVASGLAGIWNDMNEPSTGSVDPFSMRFDRDGANYSHERYHNQYAFLMAMATHEGLTAARPDERPFILSRSGFAGIQRYAANWMGDNSSKWEHLAMSVPMAAGLGISGQPFVGADIAGFAGTPDAELMVRWMQCGALTPFARGHNANWHDDQYPWSFGPGVEQSCRDAIQLRYRLLPYIYTAFVKASETGEPVQRPLVFDFQDDRQARESEDQYLLGEALMVAPILKAGLTARHVYFPHGTWVHLQTHEVYEGGRFTTVQAPADQIPVFCRAGYVVPVHAESLQTTMGYYPKVLELWLAIPDEDGEFDSQLQEDDGLSFKALRGQRKRTHFRVKRQQNTLKLDATVEGDGFDEFQRERFRIRLLNGPSDPNLSLTATVEGKPVEVRDGVIDIENRGTSFQMELILPPASVS